MSNTEIAERLKERAQELRRLHENLYRVKAYRFAAQSILRLEKPVESLVKEHGPRALEELPGIGKRLAAAITRYLETGEWQTRN